ncbi:response regulator transcription factor [Moraxella nasovis]|uniref:response regulator transcription factor n=1 Tax=Moraxella nasovis TaxID=2904121 RepID=UPI001F6020CC|nr:response regulator transcription factor [Moraxella nasovis]UNU72760.1 response regulator transcription factor [Moraxella nasovis]
MNKQILLIEDDPDLAELISDYLSVNYYEVHHAATAQGGLDLLDSKDHNFSLVVLDLMLPDMDGMQVCQKVRGSKNSSISTMPIVMLTAKGDTTDRVLGLEMGADDYISKPFEPRELLARIRAVLRRHEMPNQASKSSDKLIFGRLAIFPESHEVTIDGKVVRLTTHQFQLLHYFATHAGKVLNREQLWHAMPNDDSSENIDRAIDVHISRLRALIEDNPRQPKRIITVRGVGYQFATDQV